jgi:hypothetical protein
LEFQVNKDKRIVSIWLTNAEKQSNPLRQSLQAVCADCTRRKYKVAVFLSGEGELIHSTQSLLLYNRCLGAKV